MPDKLPVTVCIPVLKRYDLLKHLLDSLNASLVKTDVMVIDNGDDTERLDRATMDFKGNIELYEPRKNLGVAASWNHFIDTVPEIRIICNDDIIFGEDSIRQLVETPGDFVTATEGLAFSCFKISDTLVEEIGLFDETISPDYAYFEDCDYEERMYASGKLITHIDCGVTHAASSTLAKATPQERRAHDIKFITAQENFRRKWGRLPRGMQEQ